MADEIKPLPIKDAALEQIDNLGSDFASSDFDASLKQSTAAARGKSLSEFPGDVPTDTDDSLVGESGSVDDDALRAAVTAEPVATEATEPAAKAEPAAAAESTPAAAPIAAKSADKPAEPAKAEPRVYDPAEKFAIADGVEITREQLTQGLRERQAWGQAVSVFQDVFKCTPEQAQQYWKPYVERLVAEPKLGEWIDSSISMYDNPAKLEYIQKCAAFFDSESPTPQQAARPQAAAIPPEVAQELAASRAFRQQMETQTAMQQVATEKQNLVGQYPQLADDTLMQLVAQRTYAVLAEQERAGVAQTYRLTDAARDLKHVIDRWGAPAQPVAPAPAKVPALNTSSGASATTRPAPDTKPRKFANPDEALADWARVAPSLGYS